MSCPCELRVGCIFTPSPQSSPKMGEEVRGTEMMVMQRSSSRGKRERGEGDRPGPARFFVAGPPQNDIRGAIFAVMRMGVRGEGGRLASRPYQMGGEGGCPHLNPLPGWERR